MIMWGDATNDQTLSPGFAWLLNLDQPDQDALATVSQDAEVYADQLYHWTAYKTLPDAHGVIGDADDVHGAAASMDAAKRQCEQALGLDICPQHPVRERLT